MATSVSVAISRDLTGFGLEPSHHRKGAGWEPSPGGSWAGVTEPSEPHLLRGTSLLHPETPAPPSPGSVEPQRWYKGVYAQIGTC